MLVHLSRILIIKVSRFFVFQRATKHHTPGVIKTRMRLTAGMQQSKLNTPLPPNLHSFQGNAAIWKIARWRGKIPGWKPPLARRRLRDARRAYFRDPPGPRERDSSALKETHWRPDTTPRDDRGFGDHVMLKVTDCNPITACLGLTAQGFSPSCFLPIPPAHFINVRISNDTNKYRWAVLAVRWVIPVESPSPVTGIIGRWLKW